MATHALDGAAPRAKQPLYGTVAASNRIHPLERTRNWQANADIAADYARSRRGEGKTSIQAAGERLDNASIMLGYINDDPRVEVVEDLHVEVEREYFQARDKYMAELVKLTGETAADLERRVAA